MKHTFHGVEKTTTGGDSPCNRAIDRSLKRGPLAELAAHNKSIDPLLAVWCFGPFWHLSTPFHCPGPVCPTWLWSLTSHRPRMEGIRYQEWTRAMVKRCQKEYLNVDIWTYLDHFGPVLLNSFGLILPFGVITILCRSGQHENP